MGWNSWNCWGLTISQEKVIASAQALIDKGLADHGYNYINIDDGWEADVRNPDGSIEANEKFPSMKGLIDWLHDRGLKFGIYSGPGETTCGGYLASLGYEKKDAEKYNEWGVDYLKYDWCSSSYVSSLATSSTASVLLVAHRYIFGDSTATATAGVRLRTSKILGKPSILSVSVCRKVNHSTRL